MVKYHISASMFVLKKVSFTDIGHLRRLYRTTCLLYRILNAFEMGESYIKRQEGELQALQALQALQGLQALQAIFMDNFRDLREEVIYLLKGN